MPTYRDYIAIDATEFLVGRFMLEKSCAETGEIMRAIWKAYREGDYEFIKSFPFVHAVYPPRAKRSRRQWVPRHIQDEVKSIGYCLFCRSTKRLTVDHIKPVIKGGTNERSNLQCLCHSCNSRKQARWDGD